MNSRRISGVLLHVTSLPSFGGVGDFGPAAYGFVDSLMNRYEKAGAIIYSKKPTQLPLGN